MSRCFFNMIKATKFITNEIYECFTFLVLLSNEIFRLGICVAKFICPVF